MEDFVGNGAFKAFLPKLLEEGWDGVPTLKIMNSEDMVAINMTQKQKEALQIRSYLHDHALMQYGDKLEDSGKCLPELFGLSIADLSGQFGMKRGHIARFMDRTNACAPDPLPESSSLLSRQRTTTASGSNSSNKVELISGNSRNSTNYNILTEQSMADLEIKGEHISKGIVAAAPAKPRACGCIQAPPIVDRVPPYAAIDSISIQKLTPEYKIGTECLEKTMAPPVKASELWRDKQLCIMCQAEAHQLDAKKPIFEALGIQLFAILHEHIEAEEYDQLQLLPFPNSKMSVYRKICNYNNFCPLMTTGQRLLASLLGDSILLDKGMNFFGALGEGKLLKDKFISGFLFNPRAIANYKHAKAMGLEKNFKGKSGIAYQFIGRNFGDWAPPAGVNEYNQRQSQVESFNL
ncbi:hypothetical protein NMG60_11009416 [Bertholletia excelsa]